MDGILLKLVGMEIWDVASKFVQRSTSYYWLQIEYSYYLCAR